MRERNIGNRVLRYRNDTVDKGEVLVVKVEGLKCGEA